MKLIIDESTAKKRADVILANAETNYSRAALGKLFDMGLVTIDGMPAKRGDKPKIGQIFEADLSPIQQEPDVIELPVLYEDDDVIVIDKPAGIISHSRGRYWQEASVASFIRDKTKGMSGDRAGIVHRLDRATSGVMIAAKNEAAQKFLQKQFADKKVKKQYVALITGIPENAEAHIIAALARNPKIPQQFMVDTDGKYAETEYHVTASKDGLSMVTLLPMTGRTHQLRVHMQYIGHPIVGDVLYGIHAEKERRMYLHAETLHIVLPSGNSTVFRAPLPELFAKRFNYAE
jgi:23S rRNA pseudouridine1911/1915/1917 synthase